MEIFGIFFGIVFIVFIISMINGILNKINLNKILNQFNQKKISANEALEKVINILLLKKRSGKYCAHPESRSNKKYKKGFQILKEIFSFEENKVNQIKEIEKLYEKLNEVSDEYWLHRSKNFNRPVGQGADYSARIAEDKAESNFQPLAKKFNSMLENLSISKK